MPVEYKYLSEEQRAFFLKHGWIKIPQAMNPELRKLWLDDVWVRLGYDEHDPSTWTEEYVKLPRHREVRAEEFAPDAWRAACELVGSEDRVMENRERYNGDNFILNFGSDHWKTHEVPPQEVTGWHTDNDWYRQFLDSAGSALVMIHCFTDILPGGGGTLLCEDGTTELVKTLYDHPQGLEVPFAQRWTHVRNCKVFTEVTAKAGDTFICHCYTLHTASKNHHRNLRAITNPHVNLKEPFNLNRADPSDYSLVEQLILDRLGRTSLPEWHITAPRRTFYPRNYTVRASRVPEELERMIAAARAKGLGPESVDSIYLKGEEAIREHERRNGFDLPDGPNAYAKGTMMYSDDIVVKRAVDENADLSMIEPVKLGEVKA
ncbi:hypothetical protein DACRYDRAFT_46009 [Dacryopinax primogenitus]|uniref:PhyH-domain-containing protein n=1 Tax=Dacryopinax primogenitus (strain DJM 731) TaxID=1858805 RepID=M5GEB4_DACPD|nr:uncharacterized protein DACRYDRAFT_46009 [Dacryopinax primogenitus]EJU05252.1 hypothetical protein DACRYDRAFT_46009 [Dacryopinax primogenitus]